MSATKGQREMAKVFRRAANKYLSNTNKAIKGPSGLVSSYYSCHAIGELIGANHYAIELTYSLGCGTGLEAFNEFKSGPERQGARFLWLHFVAEGLERGEIEL